MAAPEILAVIMAGGAGTRFWPLSRRARPKQFLRLLGPRTLIEDTVARIVPLVPMKNIHVCTVQSQCHLLKEYLPELQEPIVEPEPKNTAICLMLSLKHLMTKGYSDNAVMVVFPADHFIADEIAFRQALQQAAAFASDGRCLVTLGIVPDRPHTGYGYIEAETPETDFSRVKRFVEKPNRPLAETFLKSGSFYWNAGIFVWTLGAMRRAFERWMPDEWTLLANTSGPQDTVTAYHRLPSVPIDVGILEKADNLYVLPVNIGWNDVGSWSALYQLRAMTDDGNAVLQGTLRARESTGCLIHVPEDRTVALVGVKDLIVVESGDTLLIVDRSQDQSVRQLQQDLEPA